MMSAAEISAKRRIETSARARLPAPAPKSRALPRNSRFRFTRWTAQSMLSARMPRVASAAASRCLLTSSLLEPITPSRAADKFCVEMQG